MQKEIERKNRKLIIEEKENIDYNYNQDNMDYIDYKDNKN